MTIWSPEHVRSPAAQTTSPQLAVSPAPLQLPSHSVGIQEVPSGLQISSVRASAHRVVSGSQSIGTWQRPSVQTSFGAQGSSARNRPSEQRSGRPSSVHRRSPAMHSALPPAPPASGRAPPAPPAPTSAGAASLGVSGVAVSDAPQPAGTIEKARRASRRPNEGVFMEREHSERFLNVSIYTRSAERVNASEARSGVETGRTPGLHSRRAGLISDPVLTGAACRATNFRQTRFSVR
jgi:hypothetical protein